MRTHSMPAPSDPGRRGATSSFPKPSLAARLAPEPIPTNALVALLAGLALAAPALRASGVGASFGGPFGAIAGRYIGGRVGGWLGTHVAHAVTGGGGNQ